MSGPLYYVAVYAVRTLKRRARKLRLLEKIGPLSRSAALKVRREMLLAPGCTVQVLRDRKTYWKQYHRDRYGNDKKYRKRRLKNSTEWAKRARASRRGDMTPWLTQT